MSTTDKTNTTVTEVRNYFNQFGPHGHRQNTPQTFETPSCGSGVIFTKTDDNAAVHYIQTDAAINPGNSDWALLDMNGSLVGIITAKVSSTDAEGMCYAIPISEVLELVEELMNRYNTEELGLIFAVGLFIMRKQYISRGIYSFFTRLKVSILKYCL